MNPRESQTGTLAENAGAETSAEVMATLAEIGVEICAACHPLFTGKPPWTPWKCRKRKPRAANAAKGCNW